MREVSASSTRREGSGWILRRVRMREESPKRVERKSDDASGSLPKTSVVDDRSTDEARRLDREDRWRTSAIQKRLDNLNRPRRFGDGHALRSHCGGGRTHIYGSVG